MGVDCTVSRNEQNCFRWFLQDPGYLSGLEIFGKQTRVPRCSRQPWKKLLLPLFFFLLPVLHCESAHHQTEHPDRQARGPRRVSLLLGSLFLIRPKSSLKPPQPSLSNNLGPPEYLRTRTIPVRKQVLTVRRLPTLHLALLWAVTCRRATPQPADTTQLCASLARATPINETRPKVIAPRPASSSLAGKACRHLALATAKTGTG